ANEARVELSLDDFDRISRRVPHFGDVRPAGRFVMSDLDRVGGVPVVMKALLDGGLLYGEAMTVTGKTLAENLAGMDVPAPDRDVALATDGRFSGATHGISVGHVAPEAAVGGPIALVHEGDQVVIDVVARRIDVLVSEDELRARRAEWKPPAPRYDTGALAKY